ncbi:DUF2599 domain-containing protein [Cellulomonas sp. B6]|uniref:DUF2599 domain-containing protein n=1 Tax=Cellulomonas sp. B6 TaxID=1295626 RepID=UPI00073C2FCC|nr:DUF2599 domain-containing protein [Cellulomonas sp. B6]KSW14795.1 hypothetical protein ATM99_02430 [Cellulomonas sp. B6]
MGVRRWRVTTAVAVLLLTAACTTDAPRPAEPGTGAPTGAAETGSTSSPAALDAGAVRATGLPLGDPPTRGSVLPVPEGADVGVEQRDDGAATYTIAAAGPDAAGSDGAAGVRARVAPPDGGAVELLADASAVLRDAGGAVVTALGRATGPDGAAAAWRVEGDLLALHVDPAAGAAAASGTVSFEVGTGALTSATWGEAEGGRSLAVVPAPWVRGGSLAAQEALASQLEAAEPEAATATMRAQLWCHVLGAPDKASWNLEPWRPEVGTGTLIATRCNPTDADA